MLTTAAHALANHWPEYLIEAALLGAFMLAACAAVVAAFHPDSPLPRRLPSPFARRALVALAMGLTAVLLIYSPLGQRSGAHMNPATTLTFLALGKIAPADAAFYALAQTLGGFAGVALARALLPTRIAHPSVNFAATTPGPRGRAHAWAAECLISALLMSVVLAATNHPVAAPYTGLLAGALVFLFITFEAPLSGMSMNPARTLASALHARAFPALWIYLTAPPAGMLLAAQAHLAVLGPHSVHCAKLNHAPGPRCIFHCDLAHHPAVPPEPARTTP